MLEPIAHFAHAGGQLLHSSLGNGKVREGLAGNGVAQVPPLYAEEVDRELLGKVMQGSGQELYRVAQPLLDIIARMPPLKASDREAEGSAIGRAAHRGVAEGSRSIRTARAADEDLALILGVEVQQDLPLKETRLQGKRPREPCLLIHGEQALHRAVLHAGVSEYCQLGRHAYPIVSTQRSALRPHPVAIDVGTDRIGKEIVLHISILLAYHVHMALQHYRLAILHAWGGRLAHQHIARRIALGLYSVLFAKVQQILDDLLLPFGGARHPGNFVKILPDRPGF